MKKILTLLIAFCLITAGINKVNAGESGNDKTVFIKAMSEMNESVRVYLDKHYNELSSDQKELILIVAQTPSKVFNPPTSNPDVLSKMIKDVATVLDSKTVSRMLSTAKNQ